MNEFQLAEYSRHLRKIQIINENISSQLLGSVVYLLKYSEKYGIKLPKKEGLESILFNTKSLLESHNQALSEFTKCRNLTERRTDKDLTESYPEVLNTSTLKYGIDR